MRRAPAREWIWIRRGLIRSPMMSCICVVYQIGRVCFRVLIDYTNTPILARHRVVAIISMSSFILQRRHFERPIAPSSESIAFKYKGHKHQECPIAHGILIPIRIGSVPCKIRPEPPGARVTESEIEANSRIIDKRWIIGSCSMEHLSLIRMAMALQSQEIAFNRVFLPQYWILNSLNPDDCKSIHGFKKPLLYLFELKTLRV